MRTRSGLPVRIYATDGGAPFVIHGAILLDGAWLAYEWTATGQWNKDGTPDELDILEYARDTPRCEECRGTGFIGEKFCSCALGRDLEKVQCRIGRIVD